MPPSGPHQPIPDSTQVHVDRLVGSLVGGYRLAAKVGEGRFGTLYRAEPAPGGAPVTLQVLRAGLTGNDEEVRAAAALKCDGIAAVTTFGSLDDGRRYRVFASFLGESVEQLVERRGPLAPGDAAELLAQVAAVLETAHAWRMAHGSLGASGVFRVEGVVKVIDFGLARAQVTADADLWALGAVGVTLLTGKPADDPPAQLRDVTPSALTAVLRDLLDRRLPSATVARKELQALAGHATEPAPAAAPVTQSSPAAPVPAPGSRRGLVLAAVVATLAGLALLAWPGRTVSVEAGEGQGPAGTSEAPLLDAGLSPEAELSAAEFPEDEEEGDEADGGTPGEASATASAATTPRAGEPRVRAPRAVPSARALQEEISRLETRLRRKARPGDDLDQALFVLNKQRLRLTGDPTEKDRQDVARQLAGWRKSYLRR